MSLLDPARLGQSLTLLHERSPLVQCLTNSVATNWTANVLLAAGAAPAMVDNPHEAGVFAGFADGVLVNLGTPTNDSAEAMRLAVAAAGQAGTPWVLDPVAVGALPWRTELAHELLATSSPAIIRGNASEISGLAGGAGGRGVDSTSAPESVLDEAADLVSRHSCTIAISGPVDQIVGAASRHELANGHVWLTKVTAVGCALGALMAAYAGVEDDPTVAAAAATAHLTVAADLAAARTVEAYGGHAAGQVGTFAVHLLDALAGVTAADLERLTRLTSHQPVRS